MKGLGVFAPSNSENPLSWITETGVLESVVKRDTKTKDRRRKMPGVGDKLEHGAPPAAGGHEAIDAGSGLSPNLQAHIGRHVRAVFDEVAREPVPEHLLRLLKDLERSGDK